MLKPERAAKKNKGKEKKKDNDKENKNKYEIYLDKYYSKLFINQYFK